MTKTKKTSVLTILFFCLTGFISPLMAQPEEKFLYIPPAYQRVVVQKDIEYRKKGENSLKFDFYRLPNSEKSEALPVVIFMNGNGNPTLKESPYQIEWAKACAATGLVAITYRSHYDNQTKNPAPMLQQVSEDFDLLVAHLRENQKKFGLDPNKIIVHAASGNVESGLPIVMDKKRDFIKAAVIYYGISNEVKEIRLDLPVFFVRVGLDQTNVNRAIDSFLPKALAANAPFEIVNHSGGLHPFEIGQEDEISREIIYRTIEFMHKAVSKKMQDSIQATLDVATANAALLNENWAVAISIYTKLAEKNPQDYEFPRKLGDAFFGAKEYAKAIEEYERSYSLGHWRKRDISYPASVASVKLGNLEVTMKWLNRLVAKLFDRTVLLTDPNFESLRNEPRFRELIEKGNK